MLRIQIIKQSLQKITNYSCGVVYMALIDTIFIFSLPAV